MPIEQSVLESLLREAFPQAQIKIVDLIGDNDHYELSIACSSLKGLSKVTQHKLIYKAISDYIGKDLHALAIKINEVI